MRIQNVLALLLVALSWMIAGHTAIAPWFEGAAAQSASQRLIADYQVLFEFTQNDKEVGASSDDQITVMFSSRSAESTSVPVPFFGEDILQEFSFSATNVVKGHLRFSRRVRDKSFIDARFIRVVNYGGDGWTGDRISLTVDGEAILRSVGMWPRRGRSTGQSARGGIEKFNPKDWGSRSYWEAELQPFRKR